MRFADIPGHASVKQRLREMADTGRIPHALLLEGQAGIGKYALARAFAQYIHCTARTVDGDSCGRCPSCLQHQSFNHIDTLYSFPLLKKNSRPTVSDDYATEFRTFMDSDMFMDFSAWLDTLGNPNGQPMIYVEEASALMERLNLAARQSEYKIVLLWLPERLRAEAANKLLKLVEEPYADTLFIMTSSAPRSILPTIYSRTQRVSVAPYSGDEIAGYLAARNAQGADMASVQAAADLSEGSVVAARHLLAADGTRVRQLQLFIQLMRLAWQRDIAALRAWSIEVAALGREGAADFYRYCSRLLRENFVLNIAPADTGLTALTADERAFCSRFCPYVNERNIIGLMSMFDQAIEHTGLNGNAKMISFDVAVQAILLLKR